jgi:hypothetical protein
MVSSSFLKYLAFVLALPVDSAQAMLEALARAFHPISLPGTCLFFLLSLFGIFDISGALGLRDAST